MTHDPWSLQQSLSCPSCHVVGKVISQENTDDEWPCGDDYCCVDCGSTWFDGGALSDEMLKERRIQFGRLIEGRPYEPPKPKEPVKSKVDFSAYSKLLKDAYGVDTLYLNTEQRPPAKPLVDRWHGKAYSRMLTDSEVRQQIAEMWAANDRAKGVDFAKDDSVVTYIAMAPMPDGDWRTTKVDKETGTITVEFIKK